MIRKFLFEISDKSSIILSYVIDIIAALFFTMAVFLKNHYLIIFSLFIGCFLFISSEIYRRYYKKINNQQTIVIKNTEDLI